MAKSTRIDLTGKRFGNLTVIRFQGNRKSGAHWRCRCDCGNERTVYYWNLQNGKAVSCGCLRGKRNVERLTTHGRSETVEYATWGRMCSRCTNQNVFEFKDYGGRGIVVCDRWLNSFAAFFEDMGPRPSSKHSLDRIDNNGNYEPGNCRWATRKEQSRNTRASRMLTFMGETKCLTDWAIEIGLSPATLAKRLDYGWSVERAVTTPKKSSAKALEGLK